MATINARSIPDDLYNRVRLAAANGGSKIPRGGLERFVIRALRAAVENPQPGYGLPKLKLCSKCFAENQVVMNQPKSNIVPPSVYSVGQETVSEAMPREAAADLFRELLSDDDQAPAASGMISSEEKRSFFHYSLPAESQPLTPHLIKNEPLEVTIGSYADFNFEDLPHGALLDAGAIEVTDQLWVGGDQVADALRRADLVSESARKISAVQAAKEPWHRQMVGYKTKSAPEGEERLVARRDNTLALNLLDVRKLGPGGEHYIPEELVAVALEFIKERIAAGDQVLVHAHDGRSAAPAIAFLYMWRNDLISREAPIPSFQNVYPLMELNAGFQKFINIELGL